MTNLRASLSEFGSDPSSLLLLDDERPELLPYATLIMERRNRPDTLGFVEAVYEWQSEPLMFLVDGESLKDSDQIQRARRLLAMRGDAPYLGVVAPGSFQVHRIALDRKSARQSLVEWGDGLGERAGALARLANLRPRAAISNRNWISNVVLRLLSSSTTRLINLGVSHEDAISLVGRALFTRFLTDRDLLPETMSESSVAAILFDSDEAAKKTSNWLDEVFNGDLLPLTPSIFENLNAQGYSTLGNVLRRAPEGQLFLGWEEKWENLHFAHIPVGVLSQAYELYLRNHAPARQQLEGGYYTPGPIAELMVRASFRALGRRKVGQSAKVLDPAVGGGVFLLAVFRELVAEHWRVEGRRPDTHRLRRILRDQIVGFDINEAALRFSALGLYLLSIELDPNPRPVDKLKFDELHGTVLHRIKPKGEAEDETLGSLGPLVGDEHKGRYDLVIGNPPWASRTGLWQWSVVREEVSRIAKSREISISEPSLPNEILDLPFVWRAMEWAKPGGQIAFALHARLLFQQSDGMSTARQALFEALDITSVINGVDLRQTRVWPQVSAPFCIIFATNRRPGVEAGFRFVSPRIEDSLNKTGRMRIDVLNADIVSSRQLIETPGILKVLFRGSKADLGIFERICSQECLTLHEFWKQKISVTDQNRLRGSGVGYQTFQKTSEVRKGGDGSPGVDASALMGLPEITPTSMENIFVGKKTLNIFSHQRVHRLRSRDLYTGPQVIVHQSPPAATGRIPVTVSDSGVVFNESFYGYSPRGHSKPNLLARYLALVLGSKLAIWFVLISSGKFGVERDVVEKAALDRIPLVDFDNLSIQQHEEIEHLVNGLHSGVVSWEEADRWVMRLYGLGQRDFQVISETLEFNLPFAENKRNAQAVPNSEEKDRFCKVVREELQPWCDRFGSKLTVNQISSPAILPWHGITIRKRHDKVARDIPKADWAELLSEADKVAATEILIKNGSDELLIGRLAQRRYWSETQARLLVQRIVWSEVDFLKRHANA